MVQLVRPMQLTESMFEPDRPSETQIINQQV